MIDVPPFNTNNWQASQGTYTLPPPTAMASGNMALFVNTAGGNTGPVHVSCWAAVGQFFSLPADPSIDSRGGLLRFSATPSYSWRAFWGSELWRLASGDIWIGLTINEFNSVNSYTGTPVSMRFPLISWNDYNWQDDKFDTGQNTAFLIQALAFVRPGFHYECLVMIGADAFGNWPPVGADNSYSTCQMNANVSALIFDM
ncbi:MAG: hypothetical protein ACXVHB_26125 [Solirubrobacteraceae bacterium]